MRPSGHDMVDFLTEADKPYVPKTYYILEEGTIEFLPVSRLVVAFESIGSLLPVNRTNL